MKRSVSYRVTGWYVFRFQAVSRVLEVHFNPYIHRIRRSVYRSHIYLNNRCGSSLLLWLWPWSSLTILSFDHPTVVSGHGKLLHEQTTCFSRLLWLPRRHQKFQSVLYQYQEGCLLASPFYRISASFLVPLDTRWLNISIASHHCRSARFCAINKQIKYIFMLRHNDNKLYSL